jgi:indole-3-glycerol phosphate synthase
MDALFEIHDEPDLERVLRHEPGIIGINNRDLAVFKTDLAISERLIPLLPRGVIAVSESGITTREGAARVHAAGAHAVLVGEALMKSPDPAGLLAEFHEA